MAWKFLVDKNPPPQRTGYGSSYAFVLHKNETLPPKKIRLLNLGVGIQLGRNEILKLYPDPCLAWLGIKASSTCICKYYTRNNLAVQLLTDFSLVAHTKRKIILPVQNMTDNIIYLQTGYAPFQGYVTKS